MFWFFFLLLGLFMFLLNFFSQINFFIEWELISFNFSFKFSLIWDFYSSLFMLIVLFISMNIFFYCKYYMDSEKKIIGFIWLLLFFVLSMGILIVSPNLFSLILGWDGLGLTSYLLVVFYMSESSAVAGMLTFLTNRLGDVFFLFSIVMLSVLWERDIFEAKMINLLVALFFILAFCTKSAQVPFSSWLPAAMAAPTPVSSLVHSSTLVTAGVFLMIRFFTLFQPFNKVLFLLATFTLILAGLMAVLDWDMKKIIAYSTLSQLGFMVCSFSVGLVLLSFFHLVCHALFKAALFMSAGLFIHSKDNNQEFRNSMNFCLISPMVASCVMICLICLCGFPFSTGFFSKDFIIDGSFTSLCKYLFFLFGVFLTVVYSVRFSFYTMILIIMSRSKNYYIYENNFFMVLPLFFLILGALTMGLLLFETIFSLWYFLIISKGWKIFYFFGVFLFFFFWMIMKKGMISFKKYFFSSMWFLNKIVTSKSTKLWFKSSTSIFMKNDTGFMEEVGGQWVYNIFINQSVWWNRFNFTIFLLFSILFFFLFLS